MARTENLILASVEEKIWYERTIVWSLKAWLFCISPESSKINSSDLTSIIIKLCSALAGKKKFGPSNLIHYPLVLQSWARVCLHTVHWKRAAVWCLLQRLLNSQSPVLVCISVLAVVTVQKDWGSKKTERRNWEVERSLNCSPGSFSMLSCRHNILQTSGRKLIRIPLKRGEKILLRPKSHHDGQSGTLLANVALIHFILQRQQAHHVASGVLGEYELPHHNDSSHFSRCGELRWDAVHHPDSIKGPQDEEKEN